MYTTSSPRRGLNMLAQGKAREYYERAVALGNRPRAFRRPARAKQRPSVTWDFVAPFQGARAPSIRDPGRRFAAAPLRSALG